MLPTSPGRPNPQAMTEAVVRRMVRGVSTRDYGDVIDLTRERLGFRVRTGPGAFSRPPVECQADMP